jgi:CelD/BcsL family acetyltransferase involved in cellulose biosynthesis
MHTLSGVLRLRRVTGDELDPRIDALRNRNVFRTTEWLDFVARSQGAEPVVAQIERDGEPVGAFTGLIVKRFGIRILGSPFQGWMTGPMGFSLAEGVSRPEATKALSRFAFRQLGCLHLELMDRHAGFEELQSVGARLDTFPTYDIDLTQDEDALFAGMTSACRRAVRKSEKMGVRVEEVHGVEFADEYYDQLLAVYEHQGRGKKPPYGVERVREMIRCVEPSGNLLMLRAVTPDDERIATAIFPFREDFAYFWGGAMWRSHQSFRPNEAIFWHAFKDFRNRGVKLFDLGGGAPYKLKFGPTEKRIPYVRKSRVPGLLRLRDLAAHVYKRRATKATRPAPSGPGAGAALMASAALAAGGAPEASAATERIEPKRPHTRTATPFPRSEGAQPRPEGDPERTPEPAERL